MAEITEELVLKKLSSIFPIDCYIVYNSYVMAAKESERETPGIFICILPPNIKEIFSKKYSNDSIVLINNIKKVGTDEMQVTVLENRKDIRDVKTLFNKNIEISVQETWEKLPITEEKIEKMYSYGSTIKLFDDVENIPEITLSKSILPTFTSKSFEGCYYTTHENKMDNTIMDLIISIDTELYQLFMLFHYMKIDL